MLSEWYTSEYHFSGAEADLQQALTYTVACVTRNPAYHAGWYRLSTLHHATNDLLAATYCLLQAMNLTTNEESLGQYNTSLKALYQAQSVEENLYTMGLIYTICPAKCGLDYMISTTLDPLVRKVLANFPHHTLASQANLGFYQAKINSAFKSFLYESIKNANVKKDPTLHSQLLWQLLLKGSVLHDFFFLQQNDDKQKLFLITQLERLSMAPGQPIIDVTNALGQNVLADKDLLTKLEKHAPGLFNALLSLQARTATPPNTASSPLLSFSPTAITERRSPPIAYFTDTPPPIAVRKGTFS